MYLSRTVSEEGGWVMARRKELYLWRVVAVITSLITLGHKHGLPRWLLTSHHETSFLS